MAVPSIGVNNQPSATPYVNWSHPLAHGLLFFLTNTQKSYGGTTVAPSVDAAYGMSARMYELTSINPNDGMTISFGRGPGDSTASGAIIQAGYLNTTSDQARIRAFRNSPNALQVGMQIDFDANSTASNANVPAPLMTNVTFIFPSATNAFDTYVNGRRQFTNTFAQGPTISRIFQPSGGKSTSLFANTASSTGEVPFKIPGGTGNYPAVSWGGIWTRQLSTNEIATLQTDPYCFLRF